MKLLIKVEETAPVKQLNEEFRLSNSYELCFSHSSVDEDSSFLQ